MDQIENLGNHFGPDYFDVIFMNGVIGWGLNEETCINKGLEACFERLKPGGEFILGVNEELPTVPALSLVKSLDLFEQIDFPPLQTHRYVVPTPLDENSHSYYFFKKPGGT
ncbi:MAG: hypothetical protein ACE5E9_10785 [Nitrospinaceae bacterium]